MAIEKVNALTKRWLAAVGGTAEAGTPGASRTPGSPGSTVLSGAGVWPLLAFLADGADDAGRAELSAALGVPADEAASAAREVLATIEDCAAARIALGLWTRHEVRILEAWLSGLAPGVHGELTGDAGTDRKRLDAWASEHTDGLVPQLPVPLTADVMLVLASALTVKVTWQEEFHEGVTQRPGPWTGDIGELSCLLRTTTDLRALRVAETPIGTVSALTVTGDSDVDVVLVLGPEDRSPAEVLTVGADLAGPTEFERPLPVTHGSDLAVGTVAPGVTVSIVDAMGPGDMLSVTTVPFRVSAHHNLMEHAALFGLKHVSERGSGHFPGVSDVPLTVGQAAQDAMALFTAKGFTAAAVTAFTMMLGALAPRLGNRVRDVSVVFDRPFAHYAVHRPSGLILVAGWVGAPSHDVSSGSA